MSARYKGRRWASYFIKLNPRFCVSLALNLKCEHHVLVRNVLMRICICVCIIGYLYFWGAMFMTVTTLVAMFKHEKDCFSEPGRAAVKFRVIETYKLLFKILRLPNVMKLVFILFTIQVRVNVLIQS